MALTVVMYHYVRRLTESRYPEIKGLERDLFVQQLRYLKRFYVPVTGQQVIEAVQGRGSLPENAVLLTFDDGYLDHFTTVFPILRREGLFGVFFPPARCVLEGKVLDVNKIHYILASTPDKSSLVAAIDEAVEEARSEFDLLPLQHYRDHYAVASRFDPAEVIYIKRMLQVALPEVLRARLAQRLFARFVSSDEKSFAHELYMDEDQVACLVDSGMMVGSHGYNHEWLDALPPEEQAREVDLSLDFMERVGAGRKNWIMCYPYGAWNASLLDILRQRGCALGFTTEVALADPAGHDPLLLPRLDTNDLPKNAAADPVAWTTAVKG
ncbi:MAG: polysaccharide deacetylase family protein [Actinomycetota bacterium]